MSSGPDFTPYTPAGHARATHEEVARAVAAIEARRAAGLPTERDTMSLDEAVRQLQLNVTPEELQAEIHRQRRPVAAAAPPHVARQESPWATLGLLAALSLFIGCGAAVIGSRAFHHSYDAPAIEAYSPPAFTSTFNPVTPAASPEDVTPAEKTTAEGTDVVSTAPEDCTCSNTTADFQPFAEIEDEKQVDVDFATLKRLANGASWTKTKVGVGLPWDDKLWSLRKSKGTILVYAFASSNDAAAAQNGETIHVYASPHDNMPMMYLPLESFKNGVFMDKKDWAGAMVNMRQAE